MSHLNEWLFRWGDRGWWRPSSPDSPPLFALSLSFFLILGLPRVEAIRPLSRNSRRVLASLVPSHTPFLIVVTRFAFSHHQVCLWTHLFSNLLTVKSSWYLKKNLPKCDLVRISCSGSYAKTFAATNWIKEIIKLGSIPPLPFLSRGCENERARFTEAWKRKVYQGSNLLMWLEWIKCGNGVLLGKCIGVNWSQQRCHFQCNVVDMS